MKERCETVSDVVSNIKEIIDHENEMFPNDRAEFFFRGEDRSHYDEDDFGTSFQSTIDRLGLVDYEREIYNDALRLNVADFRDDATMAERIARMQHYKLPTRFADISESALIALYFAVSKGYGDPHNSDDETDGFVRVMKVAHHKIKQFNSDIITAISHLPLVKADQIKMVGLDLNGVDALRYEITNSRPGFGVSAPEDVKLRLIKELKQVWVFRPIYNTRRLFSQNGLFLAFGCGDNKSSLTPTFSPNDYDDEYQPSYGIKQVNYVRIKGEAKKDILNELKYYGITAEAVYPELANVNNELTKKYKKIKEAKNAIQD